MSYTRPPYDAADATWVGSTTYTRLPYDAADAAWYAPMPGSTFTGTVSDAYGAPVGGASIFAYGAGALVGSAVSGTETGAYTIDTGEYSGPVVAWAMHPTRSDLEPAIIATETVNGGDPSNNVVTLEDIYVTDTIGPNDVWARATISYTSALPGASIEFDVVIYGAWNEDVRQHVVVDSAETLGTLEIDLTCLNEFAGQNYWIGPTQPLDVYVADIDPNTTVNCVPSDPNSWEGKLDWALWGGTLSIGSVTPLVLGEQDEWAEVAVFYENATPWAQPSFVISVQIPEGSEVVTQEVSFQPEETTGSIVIPMNALWTFVDQYPDLCNWPGPPDAVSLVVRLTDPVNCRVGPNDSWLGTLTWA